MRILIHERIRIVLQVVTEIAKAFFDFGGPKRRRVVQTLDHSLKVCKFLQLCVRFGQDALFLIGISRFAQFGNDAGIYTLTALYHYRWTTRLIDRDLALCVNDLLWRRTLQVLGKRS
jgi:hypothetical protein